MKNEQTWINNIFKFNVKETEPGDKIVSYSQYSKYKTCPRSWFNRYVLKEKDEQPSIVLVFGNAMHMLIQYWLKTLFTKGEKYSNELDWSSILKNILKDEYLKEFNKTQTHFSTPSELTEYYSDGYETFNYLRKKRSSYFSLRDMQLIGIEVPLLMSLDPNNPKVKMMAFLDLVLYDKSDKTYLIIDIKTSKKGWQKWDKENKDKVNQVVSYKKYFSQQYNIPEQSIDVEYLILRQKVDPDSLWPTKRIQEFKPSAGPRIIKNLDIDIKNFISQCFIDNNYNSDKSAYPAISGKNNWNCKFCPYADRIDLCNPTERKCE